MWAAPRLSTCRPDQTDMTIAVEGYSRFPVFTISGPVQVLPASSARLSPTLCPVNMAPNPFTAKTSLQKTTNKSATFEALKPFRLHFGTGM